MSAFDPRSILVDALRADAENFQISNLILGKKGPKAVFMLYGLRDDLLKFAYNPDAIPLLPPMPMPPIVEEGMSKEQIFKLTKEFNEVKAYWQEMAHAHKLKVSQNDYAHIIDYLNKYFKTLYATPAIKGLRFYSFTKNSERQEQRGGLLQKLRGTTGGQE